MNEKKKKLNEDEALAAIVEAADALGWDVALPNLEDDEEVPGLLVGKVQYIDWITDKLGSEPLPRELRRKIPQRDDDEKIN